jgi:hypothetical protein
MKVFVTEGGSAMVTVPPAIFVPVADAEAEAPGELLPLLLHAAIPAASSAAAPAVAACARRGRRLFRNIRCAPWL